MTYESYVKGIICKRWKRVILQSVSAIAVAYTVLAFLVGVYAAFADGVMPGIYFLLMTGIPFALLSLFRVIVNFPRPYELYDFGDLVKGRKSGRSFPSRHAFSIFIISGAMLTVCHYLALSVALFGVLLCFARVSLGYHFPRDVIAGAILGVLASLVGLLIFF